MLALFFVVLIIAIAVALAPIILGVLGTMLALLFTALLYLAAGCPKHEPREPTPRERADIEAIDRFLADTDDSRDDAGHERVSPRRGHRHAR